VAPFARTNHFGDLNPVEARHGEVRDDQIEFFSRVSFDGDYPVAHGNNFVTGSLEDERDDVADVALVVRNQDSSHDSPHVDSTR
jgi:hypothetical protein